MAVLGDSVALPAGTQVPAGWRSRGGPSGALALLCLWCCLAGGALFYFISRLGGPFSL